MVLTPAHREGVNPMISNNSADNQVLVKWWRQRDDLAATVTDILNDLAGPLGTGHMPDRDFWALARKFLQDGDDQAATEEAATEEAATEEAATEAAATDRAATEAVTTERAVVPRRRVARAAR
jgi:hypothetical protein